MHHLSSIKHQHITDRLSAYVCMYRRALSVPRLDVDGGKKRNQTRREGAIHRARPPGMMHVYSEQNRTEQASRAAGSSG